MTGEKLVGEQSESKKETSDKLIMSRNFIVRLIKAIVPNESRELS